MDKWKYDGFISYSTRADSDLAPKIQDGLERLAKPWTKRKALKIFQDVDDLAASGDLERTLRSELKQTRTLVFLASPDAATSKWCDDELSYWIEERPGNELVVVLTEGTLEFDKDADPPVVFERSTAAPPAFAKLASVPLYVDMRYDPEHVAGLDLRADPDFRLRLTKIAAVLHSNKTGNEVQPRDLDSRDLVEFRKARRARQLAAAALALLTAVAVVFALVAVQQRRSAVRLGDEAQSRALAVSSEQLLQSDQQLALMLALEAADSAETPQVSSAFYAAVTSPWRATLPDLSSASAVSVNRDGSRVAAVGGAGVVVWNPESGEVTSLSAGLAYTVDFAPDGSQLVTAGPDGVQIWDENGKRLSVLTDEFTTSAEFAADGRHVLSVGNGVVLWDLSDPSQPPRTVFDDSDVITASLDSGLTRLLVTSSSGVFVRDLDGIAAPIEITNAMVSSARFSSDGSSVVTATNLNFGAFFGAFPDGVTVWPVDGGVPLTITSAATDAAAFDESGGLIVAAGFEAATVWTSDGLLVANLPGGATTSAEFSADGSTIVTAGLDGVMVWRTPGSDSTVLTVEPSEAASYSADGTRIIARDETVDRRIPVGISVWDADGELVLPIEPMFGVSSTYLNPDGTLYTVSDDFGVAVRRVEGTEQFRFDAYGTTFGFGPDGTSVLVLSDGLERWYFADDQRSPAGVGGGVRDVDFSDDGTLMVTAGFDGIAVWDELGNEVRRITDGAETDQIDLDPGGTRIVTSGSEGVVIRSITGDPNPVILTSQAVRSASFNADGTLVVTASEGGVVIWDLQGSARSTVTTSPTNSARFAPDGSALLTAGTAGVRLWPMWSDQAIRSVLEARVGARRFSPQECVEFSIDPCPTSGVDG